MNAKKITAALLLTALFLASCGENAVNPSETTDPASDINASEAESADNTVNGYPKPDFSGLDFGGENFSICTPNFGLFSYYIVEDLTGESVNDAVYMRTVNTQEELNVNVSISQEWSDTETHIQVLRSITAGDDAFQMVYTHCMYGVSDYVNKNLLYNLDNLPYIDFNAPWWDKENIDYFRIGTETYYGLGDLLLPDATVILFNKDISADYQLPNHYDAVREGTWTLDKFISEANMVSEDLNGDGKIGTEDKVGYAGEFTEKLCAIPFACGVRITEETENGLEIVFWNEKYIDIFDKCFNFFTDRAHCLGYSRYTGSGQSFETGKSLFTMANVGNIAGLRDNDMDFGILPMFKYDEQQEKYGCYAWSCFMGVPTSIRNPELVGAAVEKFAYESMAVTDAYSEDLIRGKSSRDAESLEMLDIIYDSLVVDIGSSYLGLNGGFSKCFYFFHDLISYGNNNTASMYKSLEKAAVKTLNKMYNTIMENQASH